MNPVEWYLAKVPAENAIDPNFMAEVQAVLQPFCDAQAFLNALPQAFDLDVAIGAQLDAVGLWAGVSREIPISVQNPWFSFDVSNLGFEQGWWQGPYDTSSLTALDDDTFRRLIRAKIIANNSDGTLADIQAALDVYFGASRVWVYDASDYVVGPNGPASINIAMVVGVSGQLLSIVDLSILNQMLIPIKPAGVYIRWAVTTVTKTPVFGFDIESDRVSGFDVGAWGASPSYVIKNVTIF